MLSKSQHLHSSFCSYTLLHLFRNHLTAKQKQGWHLSTAILIARAGLIQQRLLTDASSIETRMVSAASGLLLSLIGAAICWLLHWRQVGTHHLQPPIFRRCPFKHSPFLSLTNSTPWTVVVNFFLIHLRSSSWSHLESNSLFSSQYEEFV